MDFVPYVLISKKYDFWILENNVDLTGLTKMIKMPVMVEKQNDFVQVCNFQHQKLGKNTAYLFHGEFRVCT